MKNVKLFLCLAAVLGGSMVSKDPATAQQEHCVIKAIPGFVVSISRFEDFGAESFTIEEDGKRKEKTAKGKHWTLAYAYRKGDRTFSKLEIIENYKQAALERGGRILREDDTKLQFTVPLSDGRVLWARLHTWENYCELDVVEEKGFEKKLVLGAEELKRELDLEGHVAIYGIYFDFDKWTIKSESEKSLSEIVKLMKGYPDLAVEIQGHTDSVGTREYNQKLSEKRAGAVRAYLIQHGIQQSRMASRGYGLDQPVASNDTEEGRALNRRVELKKLSSTAK
ncbi:MAG: OmpA family protein [Deltaproteobacteria bacterium]|nr:OmpA family protein [Deltaproteobacteria bacterium]